MLLNPCVQAGKATPSYKKFKRKVWNHIYIEHFVILFFKVIPSHKNLVQPISPPKRKREREKPPKIEKKRIIFIKV